MQLIKAINNHDIFPSQHRIIPKMIYVLYRNYLVPKDNTKSDNPISPFAILPSKSQSLLKLITKFLCFLNDLFSKHTIKHYQHQHQPSLTLAEVGNSPKKHKKKKIRKKLRTHIANKKKRKDEIWFKNWIKHKIWLEWILGIHLSIEKRAFFSSRLFLSHCAF